MRRKFLTEKNEKIDGLIHHYKFNNNVNDSVGNLNGVPLGLTYGVNGKVGYAIFNGSATVSFQEAGVPLGNNAKSIIFWMEPYSFNGGSPIYIGNNAANASYNIDIRALRSEAFYMWFGMTSATFSTSINGWNMWAFVYP